MKLTLALLFLTLSLTGMAQEQLNDYKYIVVPKQFADFKRENQYQTSTLIKHLFGEKGFEAVYEDALPQDLKTNGCLGLRAKLVDGSSMFTTKVLVKLENCSGEEVFATKEGKSKEKDYKDSYGEAIRDAFTSFDTMNYAYNGKAQNSGTVTVNMQNDVKELDTESRQTQSSVNRPVALVEQEATRENQRYVDRRPVPSDLKKTEPSAEMLEQEAAKEQQGYTDGTTKESDMQKGESENLSGTSGMGTKKDSGLSTIAAGTLYAQELPNGYQLVDSTPKIRMKIEKTTMPDFYMAKIGDMSGTVFKKNGTWYLEYYSDGKLVSEQLDIKF